MAISSPLIPRIQHSPWARALDGVNLASLVLMAAVTGQLGVTAFVDKYVVLGVGDRDFVISF